MGWRPCIFRLLTVNLLTLPIFKSTLCFWMENS